MSNTSPTLGKKIIYLIDPKLAEKADESIRKYRQKTLLSEGEIEWLKKSISDLEGHCPSRAVAVKKILDEHAQRRAHISKKTPYYHLNGMTLESLCKK